MNTHVERFKKVAIALIGLGSLPPLLDLVLNVGSPWPDRRIVSYLTTLVIWAVFIAAHTLAFRATESELESRTLRLLVGFVCSLFVYLFFIATFVRTQEFTENQIVTGFWAFPLPDRVSVEEALAGNEWDATKVWPAWTIGINRVLVLASWLAGFGCLSAMTSTYISLIDLRHRTAAAAAAAAVET